MLEAARSEATEDSSAGQLTIAMCRQNIVVRPTESIDDGYTVALADAVNAAAVTDTVVIIDPAPVRCDDAFAGVVQAAAASECAGHSSCRPLEAEVLNSTMIRLATERDSWTIDLRAGRFCQSAPTTHHLYVSPEAWVPVIAIVVTRTRLCALTNDGALITSSRAHRAA